MQTAHQPMPVRLSTAAPSSAEADVLFIPVFEEDDLADVPGLDAATGGELGRARERGEFLGKPFDFFITPLSGHWKAGRVAMVGAGPRPQAGTERLRRVATVAALAARQRRTGKVALL